MIIKNHLKASKVNIKIDNVFEKLVKINIILSIKVPIQDIQGLVYNEYFDLNNALKILKNRDDIISKLRDDGEKN